MPTAGSSAAVEAFLATLQHPGLEQIRALRQLILDADPRIGEGIKWNAPSFRVEDHFATFHLRDTRGVVLILHFGAKKHASAERGVAVADPAGLLQWLAKDRALVRFADAADVRARGVAFGQLIRDWIAQA